MTKEEAIEIAKEFVNDRCLHLVDREALETLIPELAESEDERIRKVLIEFLREAYSRGNAPEECAKWLVWLDGQKEQKEQKPAEWSEEDEEKINNIFEIIEHCAAIPYSDGTLTLSKEYKKELQCFIESLRPQPHTVSIKNATEFAKLQYNCGVKDGIQSEKSRRWKPTEEQMEAFKGYIKDFQEKAGAAVGGWNNFDIMIRLYEQLKNLV